MLQKFRGKLGNRDIYHILGQLKQLSHGHTLTSHTCKVEEKKDSTMLFTHIFKNDAERDENRVAGRVKFRDSSLSSRSKRTILRISAYSL